MYLLRGSGISNTIYIHKHLQGANSGWIETENEARGFKHFPMNGINYVRLLVLHEFNETTDTFAHFVHSNGSIITFSHSLFTCTFRLFINHKNVRCISRRNKVRI